MRLCPNFSLEKHFQKSARSLSSVPPHQRICLMFVCLSVCLPIVLSSTASILWRQREKERMTSKVRRCGGFAEDAGTVPVVVAAEVAAEVAAAVWGTVCGTEAPAAAAAAAGTELAAATVVAVVTMLLPGAGVEDKAVVVVVVEIVEEGERVG